MRRLGLGTLLLLVSVLALSCGPRVAQAQTLSLGYAKGDQYRYALHMTYSINFDTLPFKFDIKALETVTVQSVDSGGVADVKVALRQLTAKMITVDSKGKSSTTTTTTGFPDVELKIGPDGRVLSINGVSAGGGFSFLDGQGGSGPVSAVLPDGPVKPGDTWSKDYGQANASGGGAVHVTTKSKYLRNETLKGVDTAVVETAATESMDTTIDLGSLMPTIPDQPSAPLLGPYAGATMSVKGTVNAVITSWIDPSGHRMVKTQMLANYNMLVSLGTPSNASATPLIPPVAIKGTQQLNLDPAQL